MKRYQKLLVPLGMGEDDAGAIAWAGQVTRLAGSTEVLFIHVDQMPDIPNQAKEKYPWLMEPLDEKMREKMEADVRASWNGREETTLRFEVEKIGNEVMAVLGAILTQGTDLVIIGREAFGGDMAVRLARKAPCSVMSVPPNSFGSLRRIAVPTDFSDYSKGAMDVALAFAEAEGLDSVDSIHVYNTGRFSHRVTIPDSELREMAESSAMEQHNAYIEGIDSRGITLNAVNTLHPSVSVGILGTVRGLGSDLLVTGCRGRDTVTAWLLGGNAEYFLRNAPVPVIAVKAKGTGQKLLEALLNE